MSFEDSMIEDGYHDEEEYLNYLMDEAEEECKRQKYEKSLYDNEMYDEDDFYVEDDEEHYNELNEEYLQWLKDYPLKHKIFIAWVYYDTDWDYKDKNFILKKFEEWKQDENWQMSCLKNYYREYYPRIIKYFRWKINNPIEEILRQPYLDIEFTIPISEHPYYRMIPQKELLIQEMEDFEDWICTKERYKKWMRTASDKKVKDFLDDIDDFEFQNDTSIEHMRECLLKQLEDDNLSDLEKKKIMRWFDEDTERGCKLFYNIKCVQNFEF